MLTRDIKKIEEVVKGLRADCIETKPVDIDWTERMGPVCDEGWRAYSSCVCEECAQLVYGSTPGGCEHRDSDSDQDSDCRGYVSFDEPVMSYYYPIEGSFDAEDALKLTGPLCLVEFDDGDWALALTGGGMDYSWEICEAFVQLGLLPPVHFADLPLMAGEVLDERHELIVEAMRRSLEVMARWMEQRIERLQFTRDTLIARGNDA